MTADGVEVGSLSAGVASAPHAATLNTNAIDNSGNQCLTLLDFIVESPFEPAKSLGALMALQLIASAECAQASDHGGNCCPENGGRLLSCMGC
jgi:hypothetical protein